MKKVSKSELVLSSNQELHLSSSLASCERRDIVGLTTRDAREAMQFHTKKEAQAFCRLVGWQQNDAVREDVMGFRVWVISDPHCNFLTARGVLRQLVSRGVLFNSNKG